VVKRRPSDLRSGIRRWVGDRWFLYLVYGFLDLWIWVLGVVTVVVLSELV